jgi:hypothetical protein
MLAATIGYVVGSVGPVLAAAALITVAIEDACVDTPGECWAPLFYLLLIPVALAAMVVIGPMGCATALRMTGHSQAGATGWRCAALSVVLPALGGVADPIASTVSLSPASTLGIVVVLSTGMLVAIPVVARAWALAGQPPAPPAWERPRTTTWEALPPPPPSAGFERPPGW